MAEPTPTTEKAPAWLSEFTAFFGPLTNLRTGNDYAAATKEWLALAPEGRSFQQMYLQVLQIRALATVTKRLALCQERLEQLIAQGDIHTRGHEATVNALRELVESLPSDEEPVAPAEPPRAERAHAPTGAPADGPRPAEAPRTERRPHRRQGDGQGNKGKGGKADAPPASSGG